MNSQVDTEEIPEVEPTQEMSEPEEFGITAEKLPEVEPTTQETDELVTVTGLEDEQREASVPAEETEVDALNNNKVDVDIEPDVKSNDVKINLCSLSCIFNCFSGNKRDNTK